MAYRAVSVPYELGDTSTKDGMGVFEHIQRKGSGVAKAHRMRKPGTSLGVQREGSLQPGGVGAACVPTATAAPTPGARWPVESKCCVLGCWEGQEAPRGLPCSKNSWSVTGRVCQDGLHLCLFFGSMLGKVHGLVEIIASLPG